MAVSANGSLVVCEKRPTEPKYLKVIPTRVKAIPQTDGTPNVCVYRWETSGPAKRIGERYPKRYPKASKLSQAGIYTVWGPGE